MYLTMTKIAAFLASMLNFCQNMGIARKQLLLILEKKCSLASIFSTISFIHPIKEIRWSGWRLTFVNKKIHICLLTFWKALTQTTTKALWSIIGQGIHLSFVCQIWQHSGHTFDRLLFLHYHDLIIMKNLQCSWNSQVTGKSIQS